MGEIKMKRIEYKKLRQAHRINKDFQDWDTILYWSGFNLDLARRLYDHLGQEIDHLMIKALRMRSGGKLLVINGKARVR